MGRLINGQHVDQVPLFGDITVMFVGDFRQTFPIIQRASRVQIVNASLCKSRLWRHVHVLHLTQNMHLNHTPESDAFTQWLLTVSAGSPLPPDKSIQLPQNMCLPHNDIEELINAIYPGINQGNLEDQFFLEHTILSSKINSISSFLIDISHGSIQVGSQDPHYYIVPRFPGEQSIHMRLTLTLHIHTPLSSSTLLMPLVFLWHVTSCSQARMSSYVALQP